VRVNEGEAIAAPQVFERHSFNQRRLAGTGLPNDVDVRKAVFGFDAEDATIVAKIDPTNVYDTIATHISHVWCVRSAKCTRRGVLPKSASLLIMPQRVTAATSVELRPTSLAWSCHIPLVGRVVSS
jgi:hypothetical protein